jgi:hypothetical protein
VFLNGITAPGNLRHRSQRVADLLGKYDEVIAVTNQIDTVNKSLASVNAAHDKALAELAEQKAIVASATEEARRAKAVADSVAGKAREELAELVQQRDARQAEINEQMTLHNNLLASMGSIRAKLDSMVRPN